MVRLGFEKIDSATNAIGSTRSARSAVRASRYCKPRRTSTRISNSCSFQTAAPIEAGMQSIARKRRVETVRPRIVPPLGYVNRELHTHERDHGDRHSRDYPTDSPPAVWIAQTPVVARGHSQREHKASNQVNIPRATHDLAGGQVER